MDENEIEKAAEEAIERGRRGEVLSAHDVLLLLAAGYRMDKPKVVSVTGDPGTMKINVAIEARFVRETITVSVVVK